MPWVLLPRLEYLHFEEYVRAVCFTSFLFHAVMELMAKVTQRKSRIVKQTKAVCFTNCSGLQWWTVQGCEQNQDQCTATKMHCSPVKQWLVMVPSSPYHTLPYHTLLYLPHHTFPYHTITYHTLPYHTNLTTLQHGMAYRGNGNGSQQSQCLGTDLSLNPLPYISTLHRSSLRQCMLKLIL